MFRTAARHMIAGITAGKNSNVRLRPIIAGSRFSSNSQTASGQEPYNHNQNPRFNVETTTKKYDSVPPSSNWSTSTSTAGEVPRHHDYHRRENVKSEYQDEQVRVLKASLSHVLKFGWSEEAMMAGARDVGVSPAIVGSFPRKEAALVEFFMDECLQKLIDRIDSGEDLQNLVPTERVSKLIRIRLEMQAPYISKWPQALSIQAHPSNIPTSFKQRAMLLDEIWRAAGNESSDINWYVKRTVLGGIYSATEVYMLTDSSADFCDTWAFLNNRVKDAFDLKKTIQEAQYLAEAVGAGMGNSLPGFVKKVFQA